MRIGGRFLRMGLLGIAAVVLAPKLAHAVAVDVQIESAGQPVPSAQISFETPRGEPIATARAAPRRGARARSQPQAGRSQMRTTGRDVADPAPRRVVRLPPPRQDVPVRQGPERDRAGVPVVMAGSDGRAEVEIDDRYRDQPVVAVIRRNSRIIGRAEFEAREGAQVTIPVSAAALAAADAGGTEPLSPAGAPFTWSGFYVGVNAGAAWLEDRSIAVRFDDEPVALSGNDKAVGAFGVHAGANMLFGAFLLGVEGDLRFSGDDREFTTSDADAFFDARTRLKANPVATLRGRAGIVFDDVLLYATAGVASARTSVAFEHTVVDVGPPIEEELEFPRADGQVTTSARSRRTLTGFTAGAGVEFAVTPNLALGLEYRYTDFGSLRIVPVETAAPVPVSGSIDLRTHDLMLRANLRFGS